MRAKGRLHPPLCVGGRADVPDALFPSRCLHEGSAVLRAYFDESGIHGGSKTTVVCGFIGSRGQCVWSLANGRRP